MPALTLNKNFGNFFIDKYNPFMTTDIKILIVEYFDNSGDKKKKIYKETDFVQIKNIKKLISARFGKGEDKRDVSTIVDDLITNGDPLAYQDRVTAHFNDYMRLLLKVLCPRCYYAKESKKECSNPHNNGYINLLFLSIPASSFSNFFNGLMKSFVCYLINQDGTLIDRKREKWTDCLIHFMAGKQLDGENKDVSITKEILKEGNDSAEKQFYLKKMNKKTMESIALFENHMRPALKYFYDNKSEIYIRHGLEKNTDTYNSKEIFPPNDNESGWRIFKYTDKNGNTNDVEKPAYPIEVDKLPLNSCANHSRKEIYGQVKGYITRQDFKKNNGIVRIRYEKDNNTMPRDHFFAESTIPTAKWVFTYGKGKEEKNLIGKIKMAREAILKEKLRVVSEESLWKFFDLVDVFTTKFIMLH